MSSATTKNLRVQVEGINKVARQLRELDEGLARDLKVLNLRAAEIAAASIEAQTPIGTAGEGDKHPGRLKGTVRPGSTMRGGFVKVGGARAPYAGAIHFGWEAHGIARNEFMYRGLELVRARIEGMYRAGVDEIVARAIEFEGA